MALNLSLNQSLNTQITFEPSVILMHVKPLALLTLGIFIYGFLIFKFYKYLARRDLIKLKIDTLKSHISLKIFLYLLNQLVLVPILIFFWFLVMVCVLLFLSNNNAAQIMLVSMGTVAAIRISSYYSQSLSEDLAKLLPLTLFAVFITNLNFSSIIGKIDTVVQMLELLDKLIFYLIFAVVIEFIMRIHQISVEVIKINRHNRQIVESASLHERKSYNVILDGTFEELNKFREEEIAAEKERLKNLQKNKSKNNNGKLNI
jgi:hypothetical protein